MGVNCDDDIYTPDHVELLIAEARRRRLELVCRDISRRLNFDGEVTLISTFHLGMSISWNASCVASPRFTDLHEFEVSVTGRTGCGCDGCFGLGVRSVRRRRRRPHFHPSNPGDAGSRAGHTWLRSHNAVRGSLLQMRPSGSSSGH